MRMPDENFGGLIAFNDIEDKVLGHYKLWMNTWLAARERQQGLAYNTITRPRSYLIKQSFAALPGEEQTPIVIAVSDGFASEPTRRGSGRYDAYLRFGIAGVCYGTDGSARKMCGHYQTALLGICTRHRSINSGEIDMIDFVNMRIEDIDEEVIGRSFASIRLEMVYRVNDFASESPALDLIVPPPDPELPQPDDPEVHSVLVTANNYKVDEELPDG
jgi:hypothetical protein